MNHILLIVTTHRELSPDSAVPLSSTELYSKFQLIVLVSQPATSRFWFTHTTLISSAEAVFHEQALNKHGISLRR